MFMATRLQRLMFSAGVATLAITVSCVDIQLNNQNCIANDESGNCVETNAQQHDESTDVAAEIPPGLLNPPGDDDDDTTPAVERLTIVREVSTQLEGISPTSAMVDIAGTIEGGVWDRRIAGTAGPRIATIGSAALATGGFGWVPTGSIAFQYAGNAAEPRRGGEDWQALPFSPTTSPANPSPSDVPFGVISLFALPSTGPATLFSTFAMNAFSARIYHYDNSSSAGNQFASVAENAWLPPNDVNNPLGYYFTSGGPPGSWTSSGLVVQDHAGVRLSGTGDSAKFWGVANPCAEYVGGCTASEDPEFGFVFTYSLDSLGAPHDFARLSDPTVDTLHRPQAVFVLPNSAAPDNPRVILTGRARNPVINPGPPIPVLAEIAGNATSITQSDFDQSFTNALLAVAPEGAPQQLHRVGTTGIWAMDPGFIAVSLTIPAIAYRLDGAWRVDSLQSIVQFGQSVIDPSNSGNITATTPAMMGLAGYKTGTAPASGLSSIAELWVVGSNGIVLRGIPDDATGTFSFSRVLPALPDGASALDREDAYAFLDTNFFRVWLMPEIDENGQVFTHAWMAGTRYEFNFGTNTPVAPRATAEVFHIRVASDELTPADFGR